MIEVFITDIKKQTQAKRIVKTLEHTFYDLNINYDMDETGLPFPLGHTVLRIEGENIDVKRFILMVKELGFRCQIMEDNVIQ